MMSRASRRSESESEFVFEERDARIVSRFLRRSCLPVNRGSCEDGVQLAECAGRWRLVWMGFNERRRPTSSASQLFRTWTRFFFFATYFEVLDLGHGSPGRFGGGAGEGGEGGNSISFHIIHQLTPYRPSPLSPILVADFLIPPPLVFFTLVPPTDRTSSPLVDKGETRRRAVSDLVSPPAPAAPALTAPTALPTAPPGNPSPIPLAIARAPKDLPL